MVRSNGIADLRFLPVLFGPLHPQDGVRGFQFGFGVRDFADIVKGGGEQQHFALFVFGERAVPAQAARTLLEMLLADGVEAAADVGDGREIVEATEVELLGHAEIAPERELVRIELAPQQLVEGLELAPEALELIESRVFAHVCQLLAQRAQRLLRAQRQHLVELAHVVAGVLLLAQRVVQEPGGDADAATDATTGSSTAAIAPTSLSLRHENTRCRRSERPAR